MSNATQHQSDFMLKYGNGAHIDRLMRVDHPEWPGRGPSLEIIKPFMHHIIEQSVKNPYMSDKAAIKAASFPHPYTPNLMAEYLRTNSHREIHPNVLTAIAKHNGDRDFIRSTLADHKNMPKEAWGHLATHVQKKLDFLNNQNDPDATAIPTHQHLTTERDHYLQKAQ
jgi:hypothetical protein